MSPLVLLQALLVATAMKPSDSTVPSWAVRLVKQPTVTAASSVAMKTPPLETTPVSWADLETPLRESPVPSLEDFSTLPLVYAQGFTVATAMRVSVVMAPSLVDTSISSMAFSAVCLAVQKIRRSENTRLSSVATAMRVMGITAPYWVVQMRA